MHVRSAEMSGDQLVVNRGSRTSDAAKPSTRHGSIKFFDQKRRFGFIVAADGSEVYVYFTTLQLCKVHEADLVPGTRVEYDAKPPKHPGHKPECTFLRVTHPAG